LPKPKTLKPPKPKTEILLQTIENPQNPSNVQKSQNTTNPRNPTPQKIINPNSLKFQTPQKSYPKKIPKVEALETPKTQNHDP
jgi:hypothetical protein